MPADPPLPLSDAEREAMLALANAIQDGPWNSDTLSRLGPHLDAYRSAILHAERQRLLAQLEWMDGAGVPEFRQLLLIP